jgi:hypothetical protein
MTAMVGYGLEGTAILNHLLIDSDPLSSLKCSTTAVSIGSGHLFWALSAAGQPPAFSMTRLSMLPQKALPMHPMHREQLDFPYISPVL